MHQQDPSFFENKKKKKNGTLDNQSRTSGRKLSGRQGEKHTLYSKTNALFSSARILNTYSDPYGHRPTERSVPASHHANPALNSLNFSRSSFTRNIRFFERPLDICLSLGISSTKLPSPRHTS